MLIFFQDGRAGGAVDAAADRLAETGAVAAVATASEAESGNAAI